MGANTHPLDWHSLYLYLSNMYRCIGGVLPWQSVYLEMYGFLKITFCGHESWSWRLIPILYHQLKPFLSPAGREHLQWWGPRHTSCRARTAANQLIGGQPSCFSLITNRTASSHTCLHILLPYSNITAGIAQLEFLLPEWQLRWLTLILVVHVQTIST